MLPLLLLLRLLLTLFGLVPGEAGTETSRTGTLISLDFKFNPIAFDEEVTSGAITGGDQPPTGATNPEDNDTGAGGGAVIGVVVDVAASVGCGGG